MAKDYGKQQGVDYDEKFMPIAKMMTIHVLLEVATIKGWRPMNVKNTFLQLRCKSGM
mgnify:CR=1 FL=1